MRNAIAITCFFLSGFSGLVYEVCWIRKASLVFGSTTSAVSSVLAVFFLGLALGSYLFGRIAQRTVRPMPLFAGMEFGIGALALASLAAFELVDSVYGAAYRTAGDRTALLVLARIGLVSLVLLPPTILMGGTLPLFCRQFVVHSSGIARSVGHLYAINTLGAALGCAVTGIVLLPELGTKGAVTLGASLNLAVALVAGSLGLRAGVLGGESESRAGPSAARGGATVAALLFLTGFVALGNEVLWTRHLALLIRNTVYTYTLTLTAVLVGIVLGSLFAASRFDRSPHRAFSFGLFQVATALGVLALMLIPADLWHRLGPPPLSTYFLLLLPPAILSGISFPLAVRMVVEDPALAGIGVGRLAAMNTLGGIVGSLVVGFVFLPGLGHQGTLLFTTGLSLSVGLAAWILLDRRSSPGVRAAFAGAALLVWLVLPSATGTQLPADFLLQPRSRDVLIDHREGLSSNLAVIQRPGAGRILEIDRLWQGSDRKNQQALAAHVPMLLHRDPRSVLVVGAGTGQTASRFLMYDVDRLDCVDIEPAVFDVIRDHFDSAWLDDDRVELIREDGRNHVAHTRATYDVISIEVGQIFRPGVPLFYTADFYHRARARLEPGGFLSQFVPIAFFTPEQFRAVLATFLDAFPQSFLWYNRQELLVVGANTPSLELDGSRLDRLSGEGAIGQDLRFVFWGGPQHSLHHRTVFLASFLAGPRGLSAIAGDRKIYRDDRPVLDYATREFSPSDTNEIPIVALLQDHLDPVDALLNLELAPSDSASIQAMREKNVGDLVSYAFLRRTTVLSRTLPLAQQLALLRRAHGYNPKNFHVNLRLADLLMKQKRFPEARAHYSQALRLRAEDASARNGLARALRRIGPEE
jgi:spermidine synthase